MNARADRRRLSGAWLVVAQVTVAAVLLLAWEWASATRVVDPFFTSRPSAIVLRLAYWFWTGMIWRHLQTTFTEALLAFGIGTVLGVAWGLTLAGVPLLAALVEPYIRIANALPRVVLAPIFLLWFGLGIWSKVALGVTVVFFVIFYNTYRGVREVDRVIIDNVRMLGATRWQLIRHVLLPSAMTWIFGSLHVSIGMAIIAVVVGEYLGASRGLGFLIAQAEGVFDTTAVLAGMTVLAVGVLVIGAVVTRVERRLLRWKPERAESRTATVT
jgi:NitT/TauT family transport system permease protein